MKILVSGGTGLLGQGLLQLLREADHEIRCFVRPTSRVERLGELELAYGDAEDTESLIRAMRGVDAFVHIAGLQYTPEVLKAMQQAGVERLIIVSSTSAHSHFEFRSSPRLTMEALLPGNGLSWTVVRPSMIYGSELDHNMHRLLRYLDRSPVYPMFGSGENLWQPVYYEDLAQSLYTTLESSQAIGEIYDLPGGQALSYRDLIRTAASSLGRCIRTVRVPAEPVRRALRLAELARLPLPISSEQVLRLKEDKAYSYEKAQRDLGYAPRTFAEGITLEAARLHQLGMVKS